MQKLLTRCEIINIETIIAFFIFSKNVLKNPILLEGEYTLHATASERKIRMMDQDT